MLKLSGIILIMAIFSGAANAVPITYIFNMEHLGGHYKSPYKDYSFSPGAMQVAMTADTDHRVNCGLNCYSIESISQSISVVATSFSPFVMNEKLQLVWDNGFVYSRIASTQDKFLNLHAYLPDWQLDSGLASIASSAGLFAVNFSSTFLNSTSFINFNGGSQQGVGELVYGRFRVNFGSVYVPEPQSAYLFGLGLLLLVVRKVRPE